jgi:hypothetical protein
LEWSGLAGNANYSFDRKPTIDRDSLDNSRNLNLIGTKQNISPRNDFIGNPFVRSSNRDFPEGKWRQE